MSGNGARKVRECDARLLGAQRCEDCNTWARRVGPGGPCPHCYEPVSVFDLMAPEQFTPTPIPSRQRPPS